LYRAAIEEDFARALKIVPDHVEILLSRGRAYLGWGLYVMEQVQDPDALLAAALLDFTRAAELEPTSAEAWAERAYTEGQRARMLWVYEDRRAAIDAVGRAEEGFARALTLNPRNADTFWRRAYIRAEFGRAREALADYDEALNLNPSLEAFLKPFIERARAKLKPDEDF
jgi:tetratricopeptide (TPR) repeat protein